MRHEDEFTIVDTKRIAANTAIKNILNVVDLAFDADEQYSRRREKVRKVVMDEINNLYRAFVEDGK